MGFPLRVTWDKENPDVFVMHKGRTSRGESLEALAGLFCSYSYGSHHHLLPVTLNPFLPPSGKWFTLVQGCLSAAGFTFT